MEPVTIRDMKSDDVPIVIAIERDSFSTPWSEQSFYGEVYGRYSIARVAVTGSVIVGYCIGRIMLDEGHLFDLAIHPGYRQRGIGRQLLEDLVRGLIINKCTVLFLEARASNTAARGLYQSLGFTHIGTRKKYYQDPSEDAVLMMLPLNEAD
jgi:ribosomal-protein-alanine N-acetyltransferase